MDLLTHALIGAGAGAATQARTVKVRASAFAGAAAALLVDVDYFIRSSDDPLLQIELHRHFTHALVFIPVGALLASLLLWPFLRRRLMHHELYLAALAGYATHWAVDVCTSYGVHLFWPFSDQRVALDLVSVIDPAFTLLVGLPVAWALWQRDRRPLLAAVALGACYLGFAAWQQTQAHALALTSAQQRGHDPASMLLRPSFGNTLLWRAVYRHEDRWYIDAVRPGIVGEGRFYAGGSKPVFDVSRDLPGVPSDSRIGRDVERLAQLSDGHLVWVSRDHREGHPGTESWVSREGAGGPGRLGDIRFSAVPDGTTPMWGLEFDPEQPEAAPEWFVDRELTPAMRQRFLDQLIGRRLDGD